MRGTEAFDASAPVQPRRREISTPAARSVAPISARRSSPAKAPTGPETLIAPERRAGEIEHRHRGRTDAGLEIGIAPGDAGIEVLRRRRLHRLQRGRGVDAEALELLTDIEPLNLDRRHAGEDHPAHGGGVRRQAAADSDVAGERRVGCAAHEVEHVGAVEHAEMGREPKLLGDPRQHRHRDLHQILREDRARAEFQERQPDLVAGAAGAPLDEAFGFERVQQAQQRGAVDLQRLRGLAHVEHRVAFGDMADQPHRALHRRRDVGACCSSAFLLCLFKHSDWPCCRREKEWRRRVLPAAPGRRRDRRRRFPGRCGASALAALRTTDAHWRAA